MNELGLAYATLQELLEGWAEENMAQVRNPERFARQVADYVFEDMMGYDASEIDNEG